MRERASTAVAPSEDATCEPLARTLSRAVVLALLATAATLAMQSTDFFWWFNSPLAHFEWIPYAVPRLIEWAVAMLAFALIERTTDPWTRTRRVDAAIVVLAAGAIYAAVLVGRAQGKYASAILAGDPLSYAMKSALLSVERQLRDDSWWWYGPYQLGDSVLPRAFALTVLFWARRRRTPLAGQWALIAAFPVGSILLSLTVTFAVTGGVPYRAWEDFGPGCACWIVWLPLAARLADRAAAHVAR